MYSLYVTPVNCIHVVLKTLPLQSNKKELRAIYPDITEFVLITTVYIINIGKSVDNIHAASFILI
jgi:hypothetical protein